MPRLKGDVLRLSKSLNSEWWLLKFRIKREKESTKCGKLRTFLFLFFCFFYLFKSRIFGKGKLFGFREVKQLCHMQTLSHACVRRHTKDRLDTSACSRHCTLCVSWPAGSDSWQNAPQTFRKCRCVYVRVSIRVCVREGREEDRPGGCTLLSRHWQSLMQY